MTKGETTQLQAAAIEVQRIEKMYAQGERVAAIHKCRAVALCALPGHFDRLQAYIAGKDHALWSLPRDESRIETFLYRQVQSENADAAAVIAWCAKWLIGTADTRAEGRGVDRRTVLVRGRDEFADLAFIALRRLVAPGVIVDDEHVGRGATRARNAAAARHAATNVLRNKFHDWCSANFRDGMTAKEARSAFLKTLPTGTIDKVKGERTYPTWLLLWKKQQAAHMSPAS